MDKVLEHNVETGEILERELTAEEQAQHDAATAKLATQELAKAALETKKQEVLAKLGLTADEVTALLA